jgi:regulator of sigma E protease
LWQKKLGKDRTEFVIAAIPLGGYVKLLDEQEFMGTQDYAKHDMQRALNRQSIAKRMAIVLAGSTANLLLAILLYWILFMMGVVGMKPIIGAVTDNSIAAAASLKSGELIQKINGKEVVTWQDARWQLLNESFKGNAIEVQALDHDQSVHVHTLNLAKLKKDRVEEDILTSLGMEVYQPDIPARIGEVIEDSPADKAGLQTNDLVLQINQVKVAVWEDFVKEVRGKPNQALILLFERDGQKKSVTVTPEAVVENDKTIGRIGASFRVEQTSLSKLFVTTHYSPVIALVKAVEKTWDTSVFSLKMLGNMVTGQVSWKSMSGPVTIASYAGQSANMGVKVFIAFLALISISIGVLNLLPIPVLDGGHFMYYMAEFFTGKPVSQATMITGQKIGFALLGSMMILALYNDINRLIMG